MSSRGRGLGAAGTHSAIALRMSRDVFISRCVCSLVHPVIDQLATSGKGGVVGSSVMKICYTLPEMSQEKGAVAAGVHK